MTETSAPNQSEAEDRPSIGQVIAQSFAAQYSARFLWSPVCFGTGVGVYFVLKVEPTVELLVTPLVLAFGLWAWLRGSAIPRPVRTALAGALLLIILGTNVASWRAHTVAQPVLKYRYYGPVEGRVIAIDRSASLKPRYTLDQVRLSRIAPDKTPFKVRVSGHGPMLVKTIRPGDIIMTTGHLGPPPGPVEPGSFDFQRHVWFKQLGALGYTRNPILRVATAEDSRQGWWLWLQSLRFALSSKIKTSVGGIEGPFAAAIITGDRADLDANALSHLRRANLAHLLAISGLHMGLLTGAVFWMVRLLLAATAPIRLRIDARKIAAVAAFCAAFAYLGISAASIATQRAFIMVCVMLLAICLDRPALSLRAVALAALIVLFWTPEALFGPGFQMSFAATLGLVAAFGGVRDSGLFIGRPGYVTWAASLVVSSAVAGAATAPFAAAHFNQIAQFGLLANLLSVPVMGAVVMPGALLAAILAPLGLDAVGFEIMRFGLAWILLVAEFVSGLEGSTRAVVSPGPWVLPLVTFGGLVLCIWDGRGRWAGVPLMLAGLLVWSGETRPALLISESGRLVGIMTAEGRALNKATGESFSAGVWLENDGDAATQEQAAGRGSMTPNEATLTLGFKTIAYDAHGPDKLDFDALCAADLVIVPRWQDKLPKGCTGLTSRDFQEDGAMAIETGFRIEKSRAHQGTRLWGIAAQQSR